MWRRHHIVEFEQLVAGGRLHLEHVEGSTRHMAGFQRVIEGVLDDQSAACAIDDSDTFLALGQCRSIDDVRLQRRKTHMQHTRS